MAAVTGAKPLARGFTAVDLVTFAVFAALYRALWYVWHALNALFPFNQVLNSLFFVLCGIAVVVIVRKAWSATMFVIAAQLINLFLQGELLVAAVMFLAWGILGDLYIYSRMRAGADPFSSRRDMVIAGALMSLVWVITVIDISFPFMFLIELPVATYALASLATLVTGIVGAWIGFGLGDQIRRVLR
ncbi:MAG TPA: hypothetical protein VJ123_00175 [Anaerolineales bacterium]|nr:hypothetical protein [Anaerolineales bacterium]HLA81505.1 hypothetical protein [Thermoleophilia bacterium]